MVRLLCILVSISFAFGGRPAAAGFVTISPTGSTGPGGTITFSEIGPFDTTSANVNTDFTSLSFIPIAATVSDSSPVSIYGTNVNDTGATWTQFTVTVVSGSAFFQDPNNPFDPYSTYTDNPNWSVSLVNNGQTAIFSGGLISAGDSLDTFLGIVVTNPSQPFTIDLTASAVPEPSSMFLAAIGVMVLWAKRAARLVARNVLAILAGVLALAPSISSAGSPQVVPAYQNNFSIQVVGTVPVLPAQMTFGPSGLLYVMTVDAGPISFVYNQTNGRLSSPIKASPKVHGIGIAFHGNNMYLTSTDGSIHKLNDANGNGVWGEVGELDVAIVKGDAHRLRIH
jgi:hypothetical protein